MTAATDNSTSLRGPAADRAPERLTFHEKSRIRTAAHHATKVWPGPVGELVSAELLAWEDFGFRFGAQSFVGRLVDHVLTQTRPDRETRSTA